VTALQRGPRRLISGFGLVGWSLAGLGLAWGCGADPKVRGQLMIAVSADMSIPKNMNQVVVQVLDESGFEQKFTYPIRPENLGHPMPGTLAILPPNAGGQHVRVRVLAQRDDGLGDPTIRVMREAAVNVPTDRVAMLAMPLRWLCDGKVSKAADGSLTSDCGKGKTCAAGACVSATVDEKALPAYSPAQVFGGGDERGIGGECMDVQGCFASSVVVTPDGSCTVAIPSGASVDSLNVAMVLAPGGDGHCVKNPDGSEGRCFLPLDRDPVEGWHEESGRIQLPPVVCAPETVKKIQAVALTTSCKAKDLSVPLCGPWTNVERPGSIGGEPPARSSRDAGIGTGSKCNNGIVDPGEECDGRNLNGGTCASRTMNARPTGVLQCTAQCVFDVTGCTGSGTGVGGAVGAGGGFGAGGAIQIGTGGFVDTAGMTGSGGLSGGGGAAPGSGGRGTGSSLGSGGLAGGGAAGALGTGGGSCSRSTCPSPTACPVPPCSLGPCTDCGTALLCDLGATRCTCTAGAWSCP
jgi:hypothetical protein